jgi:hypothetical protein
MEQQRGREMVQSTPTASSEAHARVLSRLNEQLHGARRADRVSLGARVARLRDLVTSARGAGAERALQALLDRDHSLDLEALEVLLASRVSRRSLETTPMRLEAALILDPAGDMVAAVRELAIPEARSSERIAAIDAPI